MSSVSSASSSSLLSSLSNLSSLLFSPLLFSTCDSFFLVCFLSFYTWFLFFWRSGHMPRPQAACCMLPLARSDCPQVFKSSSATLLLLSPKSAYWRSLCCGCCNSCVESGKRSECHDSADLRRIQRASLICATVAAAVAVATVATVAALNSQLCCKCNDTSSRQAPPAGG